MKKLLGIKMLAAVAISLAFAFAFVTAGAAEGEAQEQTAVEEPKKSAAPAESKFRKEFRESYQKERFDYMAILIKKNKAIVPSEIRSLVREYKAEGLEYDERMHLLDLAATMASMYKHWHGDAKPLEEVEALQQAELKKERERLAEEAKWRAYEQVLGNMVFRDKTDELKAKGLDPVIYPHWLHQIWYDCKVCHEGLFKMKRGTNNITQARVVTGESCGKCHDGATAFSAKENCNKCHAVGTEREEHLRDIDKVDAGYIKKTADRLGAKWNSDALPDGKLPVDRFNFIDWTRLNELDVYKPLGSLKGPGMAFSRNNTILFESRMSFIKGALFDHKTHSSRMMCSTCHPDVFKDQLGASQATKDEMGKGKSCGYCHGKTAFKMAECNKCHNYTPEMKIENLLIHKAGAAAQ